MPSAKACHSKSCRASSVAERLPELERVSDAWLAHNRTGEKGFSLGAFDPQYIRRQPVALALKDGRIAAFTTLLGTARKADASVDLMRHLPDAPRSAMDYLLTRTMLHFRERGLCALRARHGAAVGHGGTSAGAQLASLGPPALQSRRVLLQLPGTAFVQGKVRPGVGTALPGTGGALPLMTLADIALIISGGLRAAVTK